MNNQKEKKMIEELGGICEEAKKLITKDRHDVYGDPKYDFQRTVDLFRIVSGHTLTAAEGALFMMCVKLSRETAVHSQDNLIDLCGYADILNYILRSNPSVLYTGNIK